MLVAVAVLLLIVMVAIFAFMQQPMFGKMPSGKRLERIKQSPNYRNGSFQNLHETPSLTEGATYYGILKEFVFGKKEGRKPASALPSVKTDLTRLAPDSNVVVWFGHSSYYMQLDGKRFLVDPVLSGSASPLPGGTKSFLGSDIYTVSDLPQIDYLLITHDHWDHLDYKTIKALRTKTATVVCALGVGEHFEYWGYNKNSIIEKDWHDSVKLTDGFRITLTPARHFSGRTFKRNSSLWTSFVLKTPTQNIYLGGDSGYDTHFAEIGNKYGPFDLAVLENGQYDKSWRYIHLLPEEFLVAAKELDARRILPVHSSKFGLANHAWDEPLKKLAENNEHARLNVVTPIIGEPIFLDDSTQTFSQWWETVK